MQPVEFYHLADAWYKATTPTGPTPEALIRSIISRAYYSVHLEARKLAPPYVLSSTGSVHRALYEHLRNSKNTNHNQLANIILNLLNARKDADYELHLNCKRAHANEALVRAYKCFTQYLGVSLPPRTPAAPTPSAPPAGPAPAASPPSG